MLKRYTKPPMGELWSDRSKYAAWLKVELAVLQARMVKGDLSPEAYVAIVKHAAFDVARIEELEKDFGHDYIAFTVCVQESLRAAGVGEFAYEFHKRLTSYDVEDPAMILLLREAVEMIQLELLELEQALLRRAKEHQWTPMIHRTHGQYAEPGTFGQMLLVHRQEILRAIRRLEWALEEELTEGKMSGAVGTYGDIDPELERQALAYLGLMPAASETQILQRDRHATVLSAIAIAGGSIERMCRTFWEMMRSDCGELTEPRGKKQRGSSAMAHKKNPIATEQGEGMPRLLRGYAHAAMENIATPEGRDISQSSVERVVFADATTILHYLAIRMTSLVSGLVVNEKRMLRNLTEGTFGVWAGQRIRTRLMDAGVVYDDAYEYVQRASFLAVEQERNLSDVLHEEILPDGRTALRILGELELLACFDARTYIEKGIEHIFSQV